MPIPDDVDSLVSELAASLVPPHRAAFVDAAHAALAGVRGLGPGSAFRILAPLQRQHFDPPSDDRAAHGGARHQRSSKLADGPPLDEDSARGRAQARTRWMRGWRG
jgi:hypothetical protein